ncbi:hypothetical protein TNCV_2954581 [Trichonephila clavipes]|nr:hypothetical protein TNCV_2954581 [Trichonephila clavipes]
MEEKSVAVMLVWFVSYFLKSQMVPCVEITAFASSTIFSLNNSLERKFPQALQSCKYCRTDEDVIWRKLNLGAVSIQVLYDLVPSSTIFIPLKWRVLNMVIVFLNRFFFESISGNDISIFKSDGD